MQPSLFNLVHFFLFVLLLNYFFAKLKLIKTLSRGTLRCNTHRAAVQQAPIHASRLWVFYSKYALKLSTPSGICDVRAALSICTNERVNEYRVDIYLYTDWYIHIIRLCHKPNNKRSITLTLYLMFPSWMLFIYAMRWMCFICMFFSLFFYLYVVFVCVCVVFCFNAFSLIAVVCDCCCYCNYWWCCCYFCDVYSFLSFFIWRFGIRLCVCVSFLQWPLCTAFKSSKNTFVGSSWSCCFVSVLLALSFFSIFFFSSSF